MLVLLPKQHQSRVLFFLLRLYLDAWYGQQTFITNEIIRNGMHAALNLSFDNIHFILNFYFASILISYDHIQ